MRRGGRRPPRVGFRANKGCPSTRRSAVDALPEFLTGVLRDLAFPKQMHWDAVLDDGRGEFVFGRPIRWLLFLYGGRVVPFTIGRAAAAAGSSVQEVASGALTYGHRFLATSGRAGRSRKSPIWSSIRRWLPGSSIKRFSRCPKKCSRRRSSTISITFR